MVGRIAVFVMSGGAGARLWPLSRQDCPKQFHELFSGGALLAATLRRMTRRPAGAVDICVIAAERHAGKVEAEFKDAGIEGGTLILEPSARDTAAAVAVAAIHAEKIFGDAPVLVVPSDHEIADAVAFWETVEEGIEEAGKGRIVLFGAAPSRAETAYGYIETSGPADSAHVVTGFVEKPDVATASGFLERGRHFWNTGIFLFRPGTMRRAFLAHQLAIWEGACQAHQNATAIGGGIRLAPEAYAGLPSVSVDRGVIEKADNLAMVPIRFSWSDLGSWGALREAGAKDAQGNVTIGDVVSVDCRGSYLRGQGRLVSAVGLEDMAVVATEDAVFVAPIAHAQKVTMIVDELERRGRAEARFTPFPKCQAEPGAFRERVRHWLFEQALPRWAHEGVDRDFGGFHEALNFDGAPVPLPKRMRTTARQIYSFALAATHGWAGPASEIISQGLEFATRRGRRPGGGWARTLRADGTVLDATEDAYDHACMLLALAQAHLAGHPDALALGGKTFDFMTERFGAGREARLPTGTDAEIRASNAQMHMLEAFLAWHRATSDATALDQAALIVELFETRLYDTETLTVGEFFDTDWLPLPGDEGEWTEPGHHFEWSSLLVEFATRTGRASLDGLAKKVEMVARQQGLNPLNDLAYGAVSRHGRPFVPISRSWPQCEAIKAAIAMDRAGFPQFERRIETRVARLFRWHLDPAPPGMWIDRLDEKGRVCAPNAPASILYHLVGAMTGYLDHTRPAQ
ncbi:AGE family epimerase/isomerase [Aquamicrobium sp. LC103]|uniref:AGE family epimerase/isomerase n=1 Tax=Aquamicrobium sp. LC103 TaxID=1120658 RepID=UPI00063EC905|nr:AGE family epimerase/isomerase [Aquamicrobium sp. LC103]TKT81192.1 mannose-1-phosphate guanylyltransferase [Aquamicrobium sp. LC103]